MFYAIIQMTRRVVTLDLNGNTYYNNYANLMLNNITNLKNVTIKGGGDAGWHISFYGS